MEKLTLFIAAVAIAIAPVIFTSCNKTEPEIVYTLEVPSNTLTFAHNELAAKDVTVTTNDTSWSTVCPDAWVHVQDGSDKLSVTVDANESGVERNATITVVTEHGKLAHVTVTQGKSGGAAAELSVARTSLTFEAIGSETVKVDVTSNIVWTATADQPWVHITDCIGSGNGAFSVSVDPNDTSSARTAEVTVSGEGESVKIPLSQDVYTMSLYDFEGDFIGMGENPIRFMTNSPTEWYSYCFPYDNDGEYLVLTNFGGRGITNVNNIIFVDIIDGQLVFMPYTLYTAGSGTTATTTIQYCVTLTETAPGSNSYTFGLISANITPVPVAWDYISGTIQFPKTLKLATKTINEVDRLVIDEEEGVETDVYFCNLTFRTSTGALNTVAVDCYNDLKYVAYNSAAAPAAAPANAPYIYNYKQTAKPKIATLEIANDIVAKVNVIN